MRFESVPFVSMSIFSFSLGTSLNESVQVARIIKFPYPKNINPAVMRMPWPYSHCFVHMKTRPKWTQSKKY